MNKINLKKVVTDRNPKLLEKYPEFLVNLGIRLVSYYAGIEKANDIIEYVGERPGIEYIDGIFEYLDFSYYIAEKDRKKIPSEGRVILTSNHPLGGLDGLALLKAVSEVRPDVKVVANDLLMNITNIADYFLPLDVLSMSNQRTYYKRIEESLQNEEAVIFFPSGVVSRLGIHGIRDPRWMNGAIRFSTRTEAPILPTFVKARNSLVFYLLAMLNDKLGMLRLPREVANKKKKRIVMKFGDLIPGRTFKYSKLKPKIQAKLLQQHTYRIGYNKPGLFETEKTIIHPVTAKMLKQDLNNCKLLGYTSDSKKIFVVDYHEAPNVMREIARLRELTFRKVGEGTGKTFDTDQYDLYYKHIVLWDENALEIVGSYRLGLTGEIMEKYTKKGLYNASQFRLNDKFDPVLKESIEVGRSFIQQKYWRSNALDYMWQGIGAFLNEYPDIKYLWGAVSISDSYSDFAQGLIVQYYKKWYQGEKEYTTPFHEFKISKKYKEDIEQVLNGEDHMKDFRNLKFALKNLGFTIPVLYRRYTDLTDYGGAKFMNFCVDVNFNNAIDGLILVDLSKLRINIKQRYYSQRSFVNKEKEKETSYQEN
jgi:putative hemolysin